MERVSKARLKETGLTEGDERFERSDKPTTVGEGRCAKSSFNSSPHGVSPTGRELE